MVRVNQEREKQVAVERIVGFAEEFGEEHLYLACHGAFSLMLTPDLLYQIWANFVPEAPWIAVARVLLSRLCKQVGYESYEMDIEVRNLLLRELKEFQGKGRLEELGAFLLEYVQQRLIEDDPDTQNLREAQEWTALAYTKPDEVARKLAEALSERLKQEEIGEVLRLSSLVETLAEPLVEAGFEPLLVYSREIGCFVRDNLQNVKESTIEIIKSKKISGKSTLNKVDLKTILLVEDELEVIQKVSNILEKEKIKVQGNDNVQEIIKLAESGTIDLILINYYLPNSSYRGKFFNGIEIVRILKANSNISPHLPIIGFSVEIDKKKEFLQYADGFYDKGKVLEWKNDPRFVHYLRQIFHNLKNVEHNSIGGLLQEQEKFDKYLTYFQKQLVIRGFSTLDIITLNLTKDNLCGADLSELDLSGVNLSELDLSGANLSRANLSRANLIGANLSGANLSEVNLSLATILDTNFHQANLTGACIADSNINGDTNLNDVVGNYIYLRIDKDGNFTDRRPHDPNQSFARGELAKLFKKKPDGAFEVEVDVLEDASKADIETQVYQTYQKQLKLLQAEYQQQLQAKDQEIKIYRQKDADLMEIVKKLASRTINVEAKAVADDHDHININQSGYFGIGDMVGGNINEETYVSGIEDYNEAETQSLHAAAAVIQTLLEQLEQDYGNDKLALATEVLRAIDKDSKLKTLFSDFQEDSITNLEALVKHPASSFVISFLKTWHQTQINSSDS